MPKGAAGATGSQRVLYDADQKLLAFLGAVAFVLAILFWSLTALRLGLDGSPLWPLGAAGALGSAAALLLAWGLRVGMQHEAPLRRSHLRFLLVAGLVLGVAVGGVPYLILRFKLEDPDFLHLASEPENVAPALR